MCDPIPLWPKSLFLFSLGFGQQQSKELGNLFQVGKVRKSNPSVSRNWNPNPIFLSIIYSL
jgi:hypothetical protein